MLIACLQMKYAIIRDPHKCLPYTGTTVEGIPANREEWDKHDHFFPTYDVVGEVVYVNGISVLKVEDGIYVPMDGGLEELSEEEFWEKKNNWRELRGSTLHSIGHLNDYIEQKYNKTLPQPGILLSRANYYKGEFLKQKAQYPGQLYDSIQKYTPLLAAEHELGKGSLLQDATILSRLIRKAIQDGDGDIKDNIIAAWVTGVFSEAYLRILTGHQGIDFDSVFRESFIAFTKSLYE